MTSKQTETTHANLGRLPILRAITLRRTAPVCITWMKARRTVARCFSCMATRPGRTFIATSSLPWRQPGIAVLALDNMGFGHSDKPVEIEAHTIQRHVANLQGFIEALNLQQVTLIGHAWGAIFALAYAAERADNVAALVFLNGDTYLNLPFFVKFIEDFVHLADHRRAFGSPVELVGPDYIEKWDLPPPELNAAVMAGYMDIFSKYEARSGAWPAPNASAHPK